MGPLYCHGGSHASSHCCVTVSCDCAAMWHSVMLPLRIVGPASPSEMSSPGKYARKTGAEVGSELSLVLLTTIREAVAYRTSLSPPMNVWPSYKNQLLCSICMLLPCVLCVGENSKKLVHSGAVHSVMGMTCTGSAL